MWRKTRPSDSLLIRPKLIPVINAFGLIHFALEIAESELKY